MKSNLDISCVVLLLQMSLLGLIIEREQIKMFIQREDDLNLLNIYSARNTNSTMTAV